MGYGGYGGIIKRITKAIAKFIAFIILFIKRED